jgi:hypothetical protein
MNPYYQDDAVTLFHGDNRRILVELPPNSVDACVTDPPYELSFMGQRWDASGIAYDKWLWAEVWRVLKPGGHLVAFGGTRTWHRLAVAIEDAGFEIRDSIAWMYGSGFPKSLDVSKAIDKTYGHWRGKAGEVASGNNAMTGSNYERTPKGDPITAAAAAWQGWGTALKPAHEPIVVARKPLIGTVAENVLAHGTGALNIDGARIGVAQGVTGFGAGVGRSGEMSQAVGRWPANVILDESQAEELDRQTGELRSAGSRTHRPDRGPFSSGTGTLEHEDVYNDLGGASRFFYVAKASSSERPRVDGIAHPTVKPVELMRYLVRLVTPPGGTVLEPFAGSGTTAEACIVEGFKCIAVELTEEYLPLIVQRLSKPFEQVMF